jgi:hypothetical protein
LTSFISALGLIFLYKKDLKPKGWLFMSFALFFIASPMELYLIYYDIQLALAVFYDKAMNFAYYKTQWYFTDRYTNVVITTASGLSILAIVTALLFMIWRPLNSRQPVIEEACEVGKELYS